MKGVTWKLVRIILIQMKSGQSCSKLNEKGPGNTSNLNNFVSKFLWSPTGKRNWDKMAYIFYTSMPFVKTQAGKVLTAHKEGNE